MKKVLIATTALTLSAGIAAADVKISGSARFGLQYNGANATKTSLEKRMTLNIDASTTADNGVTFGARVRLRSDEVAGSAVNGARVFARAGGLTVAAGNTLGAIESMPNLYGPSVGLTGLGWSGLVTNIDRAGAAHNTNYFDWDAYDSRGLGAEGIEVIYSRGDFTGQVSYSSMIKGWPVCQTFPDKPSPGPKRKPIVRLKTPTPTLHSSAAVVRPCSP